MALLPSVIAVFAWATGAGVEVDLLAVDSVGDDPGDGFLGGHHAACGESHPDALCIDCVQEGAVLLGGPVAVAGAVSKTAPRALLVHAIFEQGLITVGNGFHQDRGHAIQEIGLKGIVAGHLPRRLGHPLTERQDEDHCLSGVAHGLRQALSPEGHSMRKTHGFGGR